MIDESKICGWTKLFHPRGVQATLPLPADPVAAFAAVDAALGAGWLIREPGLEEGEQTETVGYVIRGEKSGDRGVTPTLLLYSAEDHLKMSFLKLYLDNPAEEIPAFEAATGLKFDRLPIYPGTDKPERGKNRNVDNNFLIRCPNSAKVVLRTNSRYDEAAHKEAIAKGQIYKVAKREFVRWGNAPVSAPPSPPSPPASPPSPPAGTTPQAGNDSIASVLKASIEKCSTEVELNTAAGAIAEQKAKLSDGQQSLLRDLWAAKRRELKLKAENSKPNTPSPRAGEAAKPAEWEDGYHPTDY